VLGGGGEVTALSTAAPPARSTERRELQPLPTSWTTPSGTRMNWTTASTLPPV